MKPSLQIISGWAHGVDSIRPIGEALSGRFTVQLLSGAKVLASGHVPEAEVMIGWSMGGLLALDRLPKSCKKLILISSTAKFCADKESPCGTPERRLKRMIFQLKRSPDAVLAEFYKNVHFPHPAPSHTGTSVKQTVDELVEGLDYLLNSDLRKRVSAIQVPTLLLHGTADRIIPPGASEWLQKNLPNSRLELFEDIGHALPAHRFNPVMDKIQSFLYSLPHSER